VSNEELDKQSTEEDKLADATANNNWTEKPLEKRKRGRPFKKNKVARELELQAKHEKRIDGLVESHSKLISTQNLSKEELKENARKLAEVRDKLNDIAIEDLFQSTEEKRTARKLAKQYITDFTIDNVSDINNLKQLVFLEILNTRLQKKINDMNANDDKTDWRSLTLIHKNLEEITNLKNNLGINRNNNDKSQTDPLAYFQLLKRKYRKWLDENQASRTLLCPHCTQFILLKIRTDIWEAQKHPFIKDRIYYNEHLIELYLQNKITKDDVAKILKASPDFTDWLVEKKWKDNPHYQRAKELNDLPEDLNNAPTEKIEQIDKL
jgi:DNA-directed RNA polymerase subunit RPC12/RpoP